MSNNTVATIQNNQVSIPNGNGMVNYFPTSNDWSMMLQIGTTAFRSGMIPTGIKSPEAAAIIALKARELGIPIMMGFSHIHVVNGKPTMSAELMQALARRNLPGLIINILESTDKVATLEFIRPERGSIPFKLTFSMLDAEKAKLLGKDVWKQYPSAMLFSRAVSAGLRKVCPEALMGISYTPEEMGIEVNQDGEPKTITLTSREIKKEEKPPVAIEKSAEVKRVVTLQKELKISNDDLKSKIIAQFKVDSFKDLKVEQLKELQVSLKDQATGIMSNVISSVSESGQNFESQVLL